MAKENRRPPEIEKAKSAGTLEQIKTLKQILSPLLFSTEQKNGVLRSRRQPPVFPT
jgi:hypothetical protein